MYHLQWMQTRTGFLFDPVTPGRRRGFPLDGSGTRHSEGGAPPGALVPSLVPWPVIVLPAQASATQRPGGPVGSARDLLASSVIDSLLPFLERALEDVVYELLDRRRVPTRTELEALRERNTRLESQVGLLRKRIVALEARLEA